MNKWISVDKEMPPNGVQTECVFYAKHYEWWSGLYTPEGFAGVTKGLFQYHEHWGDDNYHTIDGVTHWMPLPPPIKAVKDQLKKELK